MSAPDDSPPPAAEEVLSMVTPERHPGLHAALCGPDGPRVRAELTRLLGGRFKPRAPRNPITRLARLQFKDRDEVVLLKDISTSGVRLLMECHPDVDLARVPRIVLGVNTDRQTLSLPVAFVRLCGQQGKHVDVGFRFVEPGPQHAEVVENLRHYLYNPR
jgi:hypothetical protein